MKPDDSMITALETSMAQRAAQTAHDKTFCPSEIAREFGGDHPDGWGPYMLHIRRIAVSLAKSGKLVIYRKGKPVDPDDFKGVYRLGPARQD
jgi:Protein of unknown function (DUF3253)